MVCCIVLLSASNENYRRIEQRSLALSYAIKAIEAVNLQVDPHKHITRFVLHDSEFEKNEAGKIIRSALVSN